MTSTPAVIVVRVLIIRGRDQAEEDHREAMNNATLLTNARHAAAQIHGSGASTPAAEPVIGITVPGPTLALPGDTAA